MTSTSTSVSHKKMFIIKEELTKIIKDDNLENEAKIDCCYKFLCEKLNYDINRKYVYDNEKYIKYTKPYLEKKKERLNKLKLENEELAKNKPS